MTRTYKPATLYFHHNADLSITIRDCRGRKLNHFRWVGWPVDPSADAEAFAKGWFGEHPIRIRHKYAARFKKAAA